MGKFKVGLVGCGHISTAHLRAWRKTEACRVEGVFDVNRSLAEKRRRDFQIKKIYGDLGSVIAECDVVDVCTPPQTHNEIALKVIGAGRHLMIEKPFVTDVTEWDKISELISRSPSKITVVHNLKYTHSVQLAKQWVAEGRIGDIIGMTRQFLTSPGTDRMLVGNSHWSHRLSGGRWFETMPHELYTIHYFVGALYLAHVSAIHTPNAPAGAPADEVLIALRNERCFATIQYSANCQMNKRMLMIYGTKGVITIDILSDYAFLSTNGDSKWKRAIGLSSIEAGRALFRMISDRSSYIIRHVQGETPHTSLIRAFDRHLQGKGPAPTPLDEIDYVVRNCDRIGRKIDGQLAGVPADSFSLVS
jgi:predicted dehydrogenase